MMPGQCRTGHRSGTEVGACDECYAFLAGVAAGAESVRAAAAFGGACSLVHDAVRRSCTAEHDPAASGGAEPEIAALRVEVEALRAERDEARAAVQRVEALAAEWDDTTDYHGINRNHAVRIKAALSPTQGTT